MQCQNDNIAPGEDKSLALTISISHFCFKGRILVLIVQVPGHCLPFTFPMFPWRWISRDMVCFKGIPDTLRLLENITQKIRFVDSVHV